MAHEGEKLGGDLDFLGACDEVLAYQLAELLDRLGLDPLGAHVVAAVRVTPP